MRNEPDGYNTVRSNQKITPMPHHENTSPAPPFTADDEVVTTLRDLAREYGQTFILETMASMGWQRPSNDPILAGQLREVVSLLEDKRRPSLRLDALRLACGMEDSTFGEVGDRYGITREAVRQQVDRFRNALDLPPCGRMFTEEERKPFARNGRKD